MCTICVLPCSVSLPCRLRANWSVIKAIAANRCAPDWQNGAPRLLSRRRKTTRSSSIAIPPSTNSATSSNACSVASKTGAGSQPATTAMSKTSWRQSPSLLPSSGGSNVRLSVQQSTCPAYRRQQIIYGQISPDRQTFVSRTPKIPSHQIAGRYNPNR